jgi:hypothetical protein
MEALFPQFDTKKPFVNTSLIAQRNQQRKFLLSIPDVMVKKARKDRESSSTSSIDEVFEGQLERVVRDEAQRTIDNYDTTSQNWLTDADDIEIAGKLSDLITTYASQIGSPSALIQLGTKNLRMSEKLIAPLDPRQSFNGDPALEGIVALLDLADWLASDGFRDPRAPLTK